MNVSRRKTYLYRIAQQKVLRRQAEQERDGWMRTANRYREEAEAYYQRLKRLGHG